MPRSGSRVRNLVSRSILFIFFFLSSLFAQEIYIEKSYCIEQSVLPASFFGYSGKENFSIITIPSERAHYAIPSAQVIAPFQDRNISVVDSSEGIIVFKRNCALMGKQNEILTAFLNKFQEESPYIKIESKPEISIKSTLPSDFSRYKLTSIAIPDSMLKKSSGSFIGIFKVGDREKKIYFNYALNATVDVFKAKRNLLNGKILLNDDYEKVTISLDGLPSRAILHEMTSTLIIKNNIKEGQILTDNFFDAKKDVSKKEIIKAFFKEGPLVIEIQVTLLEDANIGQSVKIKTEQGKILNAKIISAQEAVILE